MVLTRISKILIANRGEIACRIIKTAKRMGIETIAVYSEADKNSLHAKMASQSYCIGPAASQLSYLNAEKLLSVAQLTKSQAIHPGYGFLSENVEFAALCKQNNIIFIGPPESAIRDMGIKNTSKAIMEAAGVPVVKGYHGNNQNKDDLLKEAIKIGFPIMIKAVRGGGGKGMRICLSQNDFFEQLDSAKREAIKSFNDDAMLLEKFIETPRHVEVQVFGDSHGNYVHLCERDCSVQRRHQKIIEEAPGPGITTEIRDRLGKAAVKAAAAVAYVGAGTVEFIMDANNNFYFMEMNTRLQVEHPITEMITGTDLVEWQLRVAAGEKLPILDQSLIQPKGHAFEARIYAEDCTNPAAFMPTAGLIKHMRLPEINEHVRIDTGVVEGDEISIHYDPMISKLVVWSHDRSSALQKLTMALKSYQIVGLPTNIEFLQSLSMHSSFIDGLVHTDFIKQHTDSLFPTPKTEPRDASIAAAVSVMIDSEYPIVIDSSEDRYSPFSMKLTGFRINHNFQQKIKLKSKSIVSEVIVERDLHSNSYSVFTAQDQERIWKISGIIEDSEKNRNRIRLNVDGVQTDVSAFRDGLDLHLFFDGKHEIFTCCVDELALGSNASADNAGDGSLIGISPMPGVIEKIFVEVGQKISKGDSLLTLIAMKMEYIIRAGSDGVVHSINVSEGETVAKNIHLVELKPISE